jgi:FlaA1/EpsC-like NDP-sugar epimerase
MGASPKMAVPAGRGAALPDGRPDHAAKGQGLLTGSSADAGITHAGTADLAEFRDAYSGQSVLITGAGGSIGSELCRQVLAAGPARLVMLDTSEAALNDAVRQLPPDAGVIPVLGSVADRPLIAQLLRRHDVSVILHAAAYKHVHLVEANARAGILNNTLGTAALAVAARDAEVARFVLISTDKAVRPSGVMGASKRLAELIVQDCATRPSATTFSTVRFGNVFGSSGSVAPVFAEQIARGGPVTLTDPRATRYFMSVTQAVRLVLTAGSVARGGETFLIDMGAPVAIRDLALAMIRAAGKTLRDAANPKGDVELVVTGLRPGERLHETVTSATATLPCRVPGMLQVIERGVSEIEVAGLLRDLRVLADGGDDAAMRAFVLTWLATHDGVPGPAVAACADAGASGGHRAGGTPPAAMPRGMTGAVRRAAARTADAASGVAQ